MQGMRLKDNWHLERGPLRLQKGRYHLSPTWCVIMHIDKLMRTFYYPPKADKSAVCTINRHLRRMGYFVNQHNLASMFFLLCLVVFLTGCGLGDQRQAQQLDARLKSFHIVSSRIIMLDNQAEIDGMIQNTGKDRFPFDVTVDATFYDKAGNVIGQAEGVAEDIFPGMSRAFVLMGQVDSLHYSHMELALVSLRERRKEPNLPTPPPVSP